MFDGGCHLLILPRKQQSLYNLIFIKIGSHNISADSPKKQCFHHIEAKIAAALVNGILLKYLLAASAVLINIQTTIKMANDLNLNENIMLKTRKIQRKKILNASTEKFSGAERKNWHGANAKA